MRLLAIEPHAWAARSALRDKVQLNISAESLRRSPPAVHGERAAEGVVAIDIQGVMLSMPSVWDVNFGGYANIPGIRRAVESAAADRAVKSIVLRINSPGGDVEGLAELGDAVREAARRKRVVAVIQGMGASAAYYVASAANEIIAGRMDLVGSIGTIMVIYDMSKGFADLGIRTVPIVTGQYKGTGTAGTKLTAEQEKYLQGIVDSFFHDFKVTVMAGRRLGFAELDAVTDGRVFPAAEALRLKLVDEIGTFDVTVARLARENFLTPQQRSRVRAQKKLLGIG